MSNIISMDDHTSKTQSHKAGIRDRRYSIRYPFAADADLIDLESGTHSSGVTTDISLGGCFICSSKPLPLRTRARMTLSHKGKVVEGLAIVRIVKARVGMGIEFVDLTPAHHELLTRWIEQLRRR